MTTTRRQPVQRLSRSNAVKNLHGIINTSELNDDEKNEIYLLLIKDFNIELENITRESEREETCVAVEIPECCICMEQIVCEEETTSCGHKFHSSCIHRWCETNNSCPMCRTGNPVELVEDRIIPTGYTRRNSNNNYNNYIDNNNIIDNIENPYINRNYNEYINHIENTLYVNNYNTNMIYRSRSD